MADQNTHTEHPEQQAIVAMLAEHYPPVERWPEARHYFNTREVWEMVQELYPDEGWTERDCFRMLQAAGYRMELKPGEMKGVWLMGGTSN